MFGRLTRLVALAAVVTHLWVSMVVAPWHHLVAHRLPTTDVARPGKTESLPVERHCHCRHHSHRAQLPACDRNLTGTREETPPAAPEHHDDCPICQVLAQPFQEIEVAAPVLAMERIEFSRPVSAVQPEQGALINPVSRGPPAA